MGRAPKGFGSSRLENTLHAGKDRGGTRCLIPSRLFLMGTVCSVAHDMRYFESLGRYMT